MGKAPDEIRREIEQTRDRMSGTVDAIGYKADVKSRAKESIADKKDSIMSSISQTKDNVVGSIAGSSEQVTSSVGQRTPSRQELKQGARRVGGLAQENPLGLFVGSVALGFLSGLLLPSSDVENEKIGPVADQVKEKARETGQEAIERGRQVAQEVAQSATETAKSSTQEQGQQLASSAGSKAQDVSSS